MAITHVNDQSSGLGIFEVIKEDDNAIVAGIVIGVGAPKQWHDRCC